MRKSTLGNSSTEKTASRIESVFMSMIQRGGASILSLPCHGDLRLTFSKISFYNYHDNRYANGREKRGERQNFPDSVP